MISSELVHAAVDGTIFSTGSHIFRLVVNRWAEKRINRINVDQTFESEFDRNYYPSPQIVALAHSLRLTQSCAEELLPVGILGVAVGAIVVGLHNQDYPNVAFWTVPALSHFAEIALKHNYLQRSYLGK